MNDYSLWAASALAFPTMAVVVIDTTGINSEADIIRIHVATTSGPIYDQLFWSERHDTANTEWTGIPLDAAKAALSLTEEWEHLRAVLSSRYLLAYNLDFVQERLNENALYYGLEPFHLIGDDVQSAAVEHLHSGYNLKLADACKQIGLYLPMPTPAMAQDRANGILALLQAMAAGYEMPVDDHPF